MFSILFPMSLKNTAIKVNLNHFKQFLITITQLFFNLSSLKFRFQLSFYLPELLKKINLIIEPKEGIKLG